MSQQTEIPDFEYRRFQFGISDLLALMTIVAILASMSQIPPSLFHIILMLIAIYLIKIRIVYFRTFPVIAIIIYFIMLAASLPYVYYCLPIFWNPDDTTWQSFWIGRPIGMFLIPTISFLYDVHVQAHHKKLVWIKRSLIEILIIAPIWFIIWIFIQGFLHWLRFSLRTLQPN
jgi:hypothetical protein